MIVVCAMQLRKQLTGYQEVPKNDPDENIPDAGALLNYLPGDNLFIESVRHYGVTGPIAYNVG